MTLHDFVRLHKDDEVEVWDTEIDISTPYYVYSDYCFEDNDEEKNLRKMEEWVQTLEVENIHGTSVCVNVYKEIEKNWKHLVNCMRKDGGYKEYYNDDSAYDDPDLIADYVEDVFITLSQGYYSFAEDFCKFMKL